MNPIECRQQIKALMSSQIADVELANRYLSQVKHTIANNQLEQLNHLLSNPELPLENIEQCEQKRQQLVQDCGFASGKEGFKQCIDWCDDDQKSVSSVYEALLEGLQKLQHSLQINSLLINKGRDRLRRSLGILTGLDTKNQYKTYSNQGQTQNDTSQRNIAIA
ncbi:MAG: flagellar export chaperone FlgN [Pseudomonadota bacterium]